MSGDSAIEWTDATWNPVTGCTRVSPGCAHCYALELAPRLRAMGNKRYIDARDGGKGSGPAFGVTLHEDVLEVPLRWRKPRRVFVNSMSDLFHEEIPADFVRAVFGVMAMAQEHTFQILTKRPERMRDMIAGALDGGAEPPFGPWPLPNVWLGVSIENRRFVHRADVLRDTHAAVRFISAEPLLGPLTEEWKRQNYPIRGGRPRGVVQTMYRPPLNLAGVDWLIVGGESGARHRPIDPAWVRDLRDAALHAGAAFFFKQWGGRTPKAGGRLLDGRTWDEFPQTRQEATA